MGSIFLALLLCSMLFLSETYSLNHCAPIYGIYLSIRRTAQLPIDVLRLEPIADEVIFKLKNSNNNDNFDLIVQDNGFSLLRVVKNVSEGYHYVSITAQGIYEDTMQSIMLHVLVQPTTEDTTKNATDTQPGCPTGKGEDNTWYNIACISGLINVISASAWIYLFKQMKKRKIELRELNRILYDKYNPSFMNPSLMYEMDEIQRREMNDCNDDAIQNDVFVTNDDEPSTSKECSTSMIVEIDEVQGRDVKEFNDDAIQDDVFLVNDDEPSTSKGKKNAPKKPPRPSLLRKKLSEENEPLQEFQSALTLQDEQIDVQPTQTYFQSMQIDVEQKYANWDLQEMIDQIERTVQRLKKKDYAKKSGAELEEIRQKIRRLNPEQPETILSNFLFFPPTDSDCVENLQLTRVCFNCLAKLRWKGHARYFAVSSWLHKP
ncbi:uncharacterized protein LOC136038473 isoform X2 [Artemia franciscana]|uniref:uncharacterized protein LOC136038473 isoform X2 n=1 Tax=Artemia franciscana TaxID=6661 RepID=UPI0032DB6CC7